MWLIARASFLAGVGLSVHLTLWFTVFQREVPEQAQSRVSSYDALGSFVFLPLGFAIAGPLAAAIGTDETLVAAASAIALPDDDPRLDPVGLGDPRAGGRAESRA